MKPAYERNVAGGKLTIGAFVVVIIIGEAVIYWGLSSGRNPPEYFWTAISFLFALPVVAYVFIRSARGSKEKLATFINSNVDAIRSWACVGPLSETGGYEADCEFSNGCYVQCLFGVLGSDDKKSGILRVFRFISGPETAKVAPLIKARIDGKTLKTTKLPDKDKVFDSWRESETSWKRLVSQDESIRSWVAAHLFWKRSRLAQPFPGDVFQVFVLCHDLHLRSPKHEGEWLKGKTLGVAFQFIEPTDRQVLNDYYNGMITTADKIIQYVKETVGIKKT